MLMDMADGIELDMRDKLKASGHAALGVRVFRSGLEFIFRRDPDWFNSDENFSVAVQQARRRRRCRCRSSIVVPLLH